MSIIATIKSNKEPQPGQKHRSSNNFTTADIAQDAFITFRAYYSYGTAVQSEASLLKFDIKVDKTGTDPTYLNQISSGHCCGNSHDRNLYIANPTDALQEFTVVVDDTIIVDSSNGPNPGQEHRSSGNFSTTGIPGNCKVKIMVYYNYGTPQQSEAPTISFDIKEDRSGLSDPIVQSGAKSGGEYDISQRANLYIADPKNATNRFTVVMKEV